MIRYPLICASLLVFSHGLASSALGKSWWDKTKGGWESSDTLPAESTRQNTLRTKPATTAVVEEPPAPNEPAVIDPPVRSKPKKRTRVSARSINSVSDATDTGSSETTVQTRKSKSTTLIRLDALVGYSKLSVGSGAAEGGLLNFGIIGDLRFGYFGFELDGYYSTGIGITVAETLLSASSLSVSQSGILGNIKGQIPFYTGNVKWVPKAGLGYGINNVSLTSTGLTGTTESKTKISGLYLVGGLEVNPVHWLTLWADYATSIGASGTAETTGVASANFDDLSFSRLRAAVIFNLTQNFHLGATFIQRSSAQAAVASSAQSQNQFFGMLGVEF